MPEVAGLQEQAEKALCLARQASDNLTSARSTELANELIS